MMLVNFTKEELDRLPGYQRKEALDLYHEWLRASRRNDRRVLNIMRIKIYSFLHPEVVVKGRETRKEKMKVIRRKKKRFCHTCNKDMTGELRINHCQECEYVVGLYHKFRQNRIARLVTRWKKYD